MKPSRWHLSMRCAHLVACIEYSPRLLLHSQCQPLDDDALASPKASLRSATLPSASLSVRDYCAD